LSLRNRIERNRFVLWLVFLSFPLPFIAILTGWYTAEAGRQPWVVAQQQRFRDQRPVRRLAVLPNRSTTFVTRLSLIRLR
jgi:cytochrome bd-type quinol oxidase subunit 1